MNTSSALNQIWDRFRSSLPPNKNLYSCTNQIRQGNGIHTAKGGSHIICCNKRI
uniref:Uncharacterized protein n=1 Tax=Anguilla anguilla TaxID=7936 RepID=A0A0E9TB81_ANGAN